MSDDDWDFAGADDAKMTIRALFAQGYYRQRPRDIVQKIMSIVRQISIEPPTGQADPLDDDMPRG